MWQKMNAAVNQIRDQIKDISVSIEIIVSLPGSRPKKRTWNEGL
jgi:hypothetical protein